MRAESRSPIPDGIYRAERRWESWRVRARVEEVSQEILKGSIQVESGKETLTETRQEVIRGWRDVSDILAAQGNKKLSAEIMLFIGRMTLPRSDRETIAEDLRKHLWRERVREGPAR